MSSLQSKKHTLLLVTQAVDTNDRALGFFHSWISEFAQYYEHVEVVCLKKGAYSLPPNVTVHSLGKERDTQSKFVYSLRFLQIVWRLRTQYTHVFVHMNVEYLMLAGWLWNILGKKVALWYTHGTVSMRLRIALLFCQVVFTASANSMRVTSRKKKVMGHGMSLGAFPLVPAPTGPLRLVTIGRIARVKKIHLLVEMLANIQKAGIDSQLIIVGAPSTKQDVVYERELQEHIVKYGLSEHAVVRTPKDSVQDELAGAHVFMHVSATGSLDKAPLEALASGVPVITTNPEVAEITSHAYLSGGSVPQLTETLLRTLSIAPWENATARTSARRAIAEKHSLPSLIQRICDTFGNI